MPWPPIKLTFVSLLLVALLGVFASLASARPALHAGGPESYRPTVQDRVMELPEDGNLFRVWIIADEAQLKAFDRAFAESPRLASLARQTKVHCLTPDHYWTRYWMAGGDFPIVMMGNSANKLVYKASGRNMPANAEDLADEIELAIEKDRSDCGPDCKPTPARPKPQRPDLRPSDKDKPAQIPGSWLLAGGILAAVAVFVWYQRNK